MVKNVRFLWSDLTVTVCFAPSRYSLQTWNADTIAMTVKSDHKNLTFFTTTKVLTRRQARWAETLAQYDFRIEHSKGTENSQADAFLSFVSIQPVLLIWCRVHSLVVCSKRRLGCSLSLCSVRFCNRIVSRRSHAHRDGQVRP
jgi:hypothetical protein